MSGHSKWSKIKHKKAVTDAKKSKEFSRLVREIKVAVKNSDGNIESPLVIATIEKAKAANMPKDNIERAVKNAQGNKVENLQHVLYETYGPGGVAILVETLTDNNNRTSSEIRKILTDFGITLASPGSAIWAFEQHAGVWTPKQTVSPTRKDFEQCLSLVNTLEEHEDVDRVLTNLS